MEQTTNSAADTGIDLGGPFTFPGTELTVHRMGYGAMQLAGPGVFGPPKDRVGCVAVLRQAVAAGVDHIDTSDFYGPHVTNGIIREALYPYPAGLVIVTKLGAKRGEDKSWQKADSARELTDGLHDNLRHLGVDAIDVVNFRRFSHTMEEGPIGEQVAVLADLQRKGLIKHIGLSHVTPTQFAEAQKITPIVCVQNLYNVAHREDDRFIESLAAQGIPYVPYFPLGGFTPLQSAELDEVAALLNATPMQTALAWLLHRSPNILLIPGTSSLGHLRQNLSAASIKMPAEALARLDSIGSKSVQ